MSAPCPVTSARFAALSLAMDAKCGRFDRFVLEDLQDRLRTVEDVPLRVAVDGFATSVGQGAPEALRGAGQGLLDAVARLSRPDPVDAERADIHG